MYCKNCGKELPDDARFCDKCNMSVRKKEGKMDMIEELKEERLARQKAHEIEARLKKIKKVKRKRYRAVVLVVLGIVAVWGIIVCVSYGINWEKDSPLKGENVELNPTPEATATAEPTKRPEDKKYITVAVGEGINVAYPKTFNQSEVAEGDIVASYSDRTATIIIDTENAILTPNDLMDKYYQSVLNAVVDASSATDDGYTITVTAGTKKHHKKCLLKDGEAISYEIIYPADSAEEYEKYIEYMDEKFTVS